MQIFMLKEMNLKSPKSNGKPNLGAKQNIENQIFQKI